MYRFHGRFSSVTAILAACAAFLVLSGCATKSKEEFNTGMPTFTRAYKDKSPLEAVESLLFAYRMGDFDAVYYLSKPADKQSATEREAFLKEVHGSKDWTPALWELDQDVSYTGDKESADVIASVLSDIDGFLYSDTMRFYCFLDGEHWKIAQHQFEGESTLMVPTETKKPEQ